MVWSSLLMFKIWVWSNEWLQRYSTCNILRSCSIIGHLCISLKLEYGPISGYWDIPLLIFWGLLPLEVILILMICKIWFGHQSLSLKLEHDPMSGCRDILLVIFWGCLPLEVIFILGIYKIWFGKVLVWLVVH